MFLLDIMYISNELLKLTKNQETREVQFFINIYFYNCIYMQNGTELDKLKMVSAIYSNKYEQIDWLPTYF